jgi:Holliday junction resolvase RusA-like endonuclease
MIHIVVRGDPQPQGNKTAYTRTDKATGKVKVALVEGRRGPARKAFQDWRSDVKRATEEVMNHRPPFAGPVSLSVTFTLPKPSSAPKRKRIWPTGRKNDIDKLLRAVLDALVQGGALVDDGQVVELTRVAKDYPVAKETTAFLGKVGDVSLLSGIDHADVLTSPGVVVRIQQLKPWLDQLTERDREVLLGSWRQPV